MTPWWGWLALVFTVVVSRAAAGVTCDVLDYGARGDGVTDDTAALRAAIAACSHGTASAPTTVLFPAGGVYLTAPLNLSSHCAYVVDGTLLAQPAPSSAWPVVAGLPSYFPDYPRWQPFVWGVGITNATLTGARRCVCCASLSPHRRPHLRLVLLAGTGTVDGQGGVYWWPAWFNGTLPDPLVMHRPMLVELYNCSDIRVGLPGGGGASGWGLRLQNSPFWTVHPYLSTNVVLVSGDCEERGGRARGKGGYWFPGQGVARPVALHAAGRAGRVQPRWLTQHGRHRPGLQLLHQNCQSSHR